MTNWQEKLHLDDMTSAELRALLPRRPVVLLPLGSQEDQGGHAPMGDFRLAALIAGRIARAATDAGTLTLVAPALPFGAADHFGAVAGGLALAPATFRAVLSDLLDNLFRTGLDQIIILNGHGGNVPIIHEVTLAIRRAGGRIVPSVYLWKIARRLMERRIGQAPSRFGHAGEPLASIALCLRPDAARLDLAVVPGPAGLVLGCGVTGFGAIGFEDIEIDAPVEYLEIAPNSAAADATAADAVVGAAVVDDLVARVARFCGHVAARS
ncbi:MAG: creatininase family protein [Acidiphilium sp.]|nr:creatininase family protein [Acidiphilium sp.]MDD4934755.1 creatininase family protein [Acidiphilium sp.]